MVNGVSAAFLDRFVRSFATRLELRLFQLLLANAGHALPAERLLSHVWGSRGTGTASS